jgi:hypothetical protein
MTKFNSAWKVCLYSLQVELHPEATYLDIHGVRHDDIQRVLEGSMKLRKDQYEIAYYRALERFFVIEPHEAHRLAVALDGRSQQGRGRVGEERVAAPRVQGARQDPKPYRSDGGAVNLPSHPGCHRSL